MPIRADIKRKSNSDRCAFAVRILTRWTVVLFFVAYLLIPRGITVSWNGYCVFFGPVIIVGFATIIAFIACSLKQQKISFVYLLILLAVMAGVWYVTWYQLRLRWYEVLGP